MMMVPFTAGAPGWQLKAAAELMTRQRTSPLAALTVTGAETGGPPVFSQFGAFRVRPGNSSQLSVRLIAGPGTSCPARNPETSARTCCRRPLVGSHWIERPLYAGWAGLAPRHRYEKTSEPGWAL